MTSGFSWRKYLPTDYETVVPWFTARGWPEAPPEKFLPPTGIIIEDSEGPCCVGFLYLSNSPIGFLDWVSTRPDLKRGGLKALDFFFPVAKEAAKGIGVERVIHMALPKYANVISKRYGFTEVEKLSLLVWGEG
jgi:hypothetical protein